MNPVDESQGARAGARFGRRLRPFFFASVVVAAAAATAPVLQRLPHANLSLLFMTGVLVVAVRHGLWPSIYASILSFLTFNFFFTDPRYTFKVGAEGDVATLIFFLLMASVTANLAARMRDAMHKREKAMARSDALQREAQRQELRVALLSSVSHDLRTPLASIIGAASSLLTYESLDREKRNVLLRSVLEESERLDRYIQNLLDMTRLEQGQPESPRDWEDLRDLLSAAARRLKLGARQLALELDLPSGAQLVHVHGELLEQVFVNLLDNAARYSPAKGVIRVAARRTAGSIVIEIADQGPGIPEAEREKIFDPFYRVHERDRKSGTGLGLSICRGIVSAHGGQVSAHARTDGPGALIRIRIPQACEPAPEASDD